MKSNCSRIIYLGIILISFVNCKHWDPDECNFPKDYSKLQECGKGYESWKEAIRTIIKGDNKKPTRIFIQFVNEYKYNGNTVEELYDKLREELEQEKLNDKVIIFSRERAEKSIRVRAVCLKYKKDKISTDDKNINDIVELVVKKVKNKLLDQNKSKLEAGKSVCIPDLVSLWKKYVAKDNQCTNVQYCNNERGTRTKPDSSTDRPKTKSVMIPDKTDNSKIIRQSNNQSCSQPWFDKRTTKLRFNCWPADGIDLTYVIIGCLVIIFTIFIIVYCCKCHRKRLKNNEEIVRDDFISGYGRPVNNQQPILNPNRYNDMTQYDTVHMNNHGNIRQSRNSNQYLANSYQGQAYSTTSNSYLHGQHGDRNGANSVPNLTPFLDQRSSFNNNRGAASYSPFQHQNRPNFNDNASSTNGRGTPLPPGPILPNNRYNEFKHDNDEFIDATGNNEFTYNDDMIYDDVPKLDDTSHDVSSFGGQTEAADMRYNPQHNRVSTFL